MAAQKEQKQKQKQKEKQVTDEEIFASCSFSSLGLQPSLCEQLRERLGFETPTQVQAQAIPVILSGRHVLVNAATGTGKTIAYLAPIIHHLQKYDPRIQRADGAFALVLVPTRELCMQVYEILQKLLHRFHWIVPGYIMGGEKRSKEKARLRKEERKTALITEVDLLNGSFLNVKYTVNLQVHATSDSACIKGISILIATPGRLLDHLKNTSSFLYANLQWLIFDEADRILELGFGKEIQEILDILGSRQNRSAALDSGISGASGFQRQNLLLSATLNEKVNHLAKISLENPVMIGLAERKLHQNLPPKHSGSVASEDDYEAEHIGRVIGSSTGDYNLPSQLVQRYVKVPCGSRLAVLLSILKNLFEKEASQKAVVFFSTCDAVDFHYLLLKEFQWPSSPELEPELRRLFLSCNTLRLHGNMEQEERRNTFQAFKTEKSALLLSTDVAARGLDFPKVRSIIQYDSPGEATEYVHRVGRTARLGQKGDSLLFLLPIETDYLQDLEKHGVSLMEYPLQKVLNSFPLCGQKQKHFSKKFVSVETHPWVVGLQKALEAFVSAEAKMKKMAKAALVSWTRAYATHRGELKRIFMVKKLHLGHVAKSFALKEQPSLVGKSVHKQSKKRKNEHRHKRQVKKRKVTIGT